MCGPYRCQLKLWELLLPTLVRLATPSRVHLMSIRSLSIHFLCCVGCLWPTLSAACQLALISNLTNDSFDPTWNILQLQVRTQPSMSCPAPEVVQITRQPHALKYLAHLGSKILNYNNMLYLVESTIG